MIWCLLDLGNSLGLLLGLRCFWIWRLMCRLVCFVRVGWADGLLFISGIWVWCCLVCLVIFVCFEFDCDVCDLGLCLIPVDFGLCSLGGYFCFVVI